MEEPQFYPTNRQTLEEGESRFSVVVTKLDTGEKVIEATCRGVLVAMSKRPSDVDDTFGSGGRCAAAGARNRIEECMAGMMTWWPIAVKKMNFMGVHTVDPD